MIPVKTILHIITSLDVGGAEMMLFKLLKGMDKNAFDLSVISLMGEGAMGNRIKALGIPVFSLNMSQGKLPEVKTFLRLYNVIRKIKPTVLQGWMYHGNLAAWVAGHFLCGKAKVYWNIRQSLYDMDLEKRMTRMIIRLGAFLSSHVHGIIYNSITSRKQHETQGYHKKVSVFIPNGFDVSEFKPSKTADQDIKKEFNISAQSHIVGVVARYHPMKDHETFLKAAGMVVSQDKNIRFIMVGSGIDSKNEALNRQIKAYGLENHIILTGRRNDIDKIMCSFNVLVSSSYAEAFPNVIGEAMACGVPCVVTDVGDSALIVKNTGMVVPSENAQALASAVMKILSFSILDQKKMGAMARQRIVEKFSMDRIIRQYEYLYERT